MHQMCDNFSSCKRAAMGSIHEVASVLERNIIKGHNHVLFEGRKKACQAHAVEMMCGNITWMFTVSGVPVSGVPVQVRTMFQGVLLLQVSILPRK